MSPARRPWHRRPALHFLALGALLFAGRSVLDATSDPDPVQLAPSVREALRHRFVSQAGREPSAHEMAALVRDALDEEILFREALALGLERRDPVVHQRLVRNLRFLAEDGAPERDDASLIEEALALGLERGDLVVRRRLVERMRARLAAAAHATPVAAEEVAARYARERERLALPARYRFSHVFLAREHAADADAVAASLASADPERAAALGDPFLLGHHPGPQSVAEIAARFGGELAAGVADAPVGRWHGPLASGFGLHWVWLHEVQPSAPPPLARVEARLRQEILAEREADVLRVAMARLRERYGVDDDASP